MLLNSVNDPVELNQVATQDVETDGEWQLVETFMDSGAARSVCPLGFCPHIDVMPSDQSRRGQHFRTAGGTVVPNEGERVVTGTSESGLALSMRYAVADIAVPLDSISQICDGGSVVVFSKKGGYVVNANGAKLDFIRKGDTYRRRTWVRQPRQKTNKTKDGDVQMATWAEHIFARPGQTTP